MTQVNLNEAKDRLMHVSVNTNMGDYDLDLAGDLKIDKSSLNDSFCDQPSKFAWYAILYVQAKTKADFAKSDMERQDDYIKKTLMGELDSEVRRMIEVEGGKVTETKVTNTIYNHPKYIEEQQKLVDLKQAYIQASNDALTLQVSMDAFSQRKDMLISLGAQLRYEMGNAEDISIKSRANEIVKSSKRSSKVTSLS